MVQVIQNIALKKKKVGISYSCSSAKAIPMESPEAISAIQQNEEIYIVSHSFSMLHMVRDFIKRMLTSGK